MGSLNSVIGQDGKERVRVNNILLEVKRDSQGKIKEYAGRLDRESPSIEQLSRRLDKSNTIKIRDSIMTANNISFDAAKRMSLSKEFSIPAEALEIDINKTVDNDVDNSSAIQDLEEVEVNGYLYSLVESNGKKGVQIGDRFYSLEKTGDSFELTRKSAFMSTWKDAKNFELGLKDLGSVKDTDGYELHIPCKVNNISSVIIPNHSTNIVKEEVITNPVVEQKPEIEKEEVVINPVIEQKPEIEKEEAITNPVIEQKPEIEKEEVVINPVIEQKPEIQQEEIPTNIIVEQKPEIVKEGVVVNPVVETAVDKKEPYASIQEAKDILLSTKSKIKNKISAARWLADTYRSSVFKELSADQKEIELFFRTDFISKNKDLNNIQKTVFSWYGVRESIITAKKMDVLYVDYGIDNMKRSDAANIIFSNDAKTVKELLDEMTQEDKEILKSELAKIIKEWEEKCNSSVVDNGFDPYSTSQIAVNKILDEKFMEWDSESKIFRPTDLGTRNFELIKRIISNTKEKSYVGVYIMPLFK